MSKQLYGSFGKDASKEEKKKLCREAMTMCRPTDSVGSSSSSTAASSGQPGVPGVPAVIPATPATEAPRLCQGISDKKQQLRALLCERHKTFKDGITSVPLNARRSASRTIGTEPDGEPMDPRLCHAAFRDRLVRGVRDGVIVLLTAYDTQSIRKPPGKEDGPAREGVALARPNQEHNVLGEAGDAGHFVYHIVFHALIIVADIVCKLRKTDHHFSSDVDVDIPWHYRNYNECTAEDCIEAALYCARSTWDTPGMVRLLEGEMDAVAKAGTSLLDLIATTQDCIRRCRPEGATKKDAMSLARHFMDTSETGMQGSGPCARPARFTTCCAPRLGFSHTPDKICTCFSFKFYRLRSGGLGQGAVKSTWLRPSGLDPSRPGKLGAALHFVFRRTPSTFLQGMRARCSPTLRISLRTSS